MVIALNPDPADLGLASPALGPWFSQDITLSPPDADLAVTLSFSMPTDWLPPAAGLLSLYVASTTAPPTALAPLRKGNGTRAFTDGNLVALFTLLPEVEERLDALQAVLPSPDGSTVASTVSTRARVRCFAMELTGPSTFADLKPRVDLPWTVSDADNVATLGLTGGVILGNADRPMTPLVRPGVFSGSQEKLLKGFVSSDTPKLWCFDHRGRAVDPGAVAAWWSYLAVQAYNNLWASGLDISEKRTAYGAPNRGVQLVNANQGRLVDPVLGRLHVLGLSPSTDWVRSCSGTGAVAFSFSTAPDPDDAPKPKVAMLPHGKFDDSLTLWPSGPVHTSLARDFVRVAAVDAEAHLTGQGRTSPSGATVAESRRAADQNRVSTRTKVARAASSATVVAARATTDEAMDAAMTVLSGADPVMMVSSVLNPDWGPLAVSLPLVPVPNELPALTVSALLGGGTASGGTVAGQKVLVEMSFDPGLAGCWVRAWGQGFDLTQGRHFYTDGGSGLIRTDGHVSLVVQLPDGEAAARPVAINVLVASGLASHIYTEARFDRPIPVGGSPLTLSAATGTIIACESGQSFAAASFVTGLSSGTTLVAMASGNAALIDASTIPSTAFASNTVIHHLKAGDRLDLTQPAFRKTPDGDGTAVFSATGATVTRTSRSGLTRLTAPGQPLPAQDRLEIACARTSTSEAKAAVLCTPGLSRYHELLPHQSGHPGTPAAPEHHGTGVLLEGPAAVLVAELLRDRVQSATSDLVTAAATPLPTPPETTAPGLWAAALKTVAAGTEGEVQLGSLVRSASYPFGETLANLRSWFSDQHIPLPDVSSDEPSIVRALDRRALAAGYGLREAATSLLAAFQQAEDFIYIETPALDDSSFGESDDKLNLWQALKDRMDANPSLRVVLCVPVAPAVGCPADMKRVRDGKLLEAVSNLQTKTGPAYASSRAQRSVVFCPSAGPGRNLRLASTTVIVDDVYLLTGTTHLWRRGLSYDSSMTVSLFDESLSRGRGQEIRRFRRALLGGRLGLAASLVPEDPAELVAALALLNQRGSVRVTTDTIPKPDLTPTASDCDMWNRDGSAQSGFNPMQWILDLAAAGGGTPLGSEVNGP